MRIHTPTDVHCTLHVRFSTREESTEDLVYVGSLCVFAFRVFRGVEYGCMARLESWRVRRHAPWRAVSTYVRTKVVESYGESSE